MRYQCSNCGMEADESTVFCSECGGRVVAIQDESDTAQSIRTGGGGFCSNCGAGLDPESIFCPECGTPIDSSAMQNGSTPDMAKGAAIGNVPNGMNSSNMQFTGKKVRSPKASQRNSSPIKRRLMMIYSGMLATAVVAALLLVLLSFVGESVTGIFYYKDGKTYYASGTDSEWICNRKVSPVHNQNGELKPDQKNRIFFHEGSDYYYRDLSQNENSDKAIVRLGSGIDGFYSSNIDSPEGYDLLYRKYDALYLGNGKEETMIYRDSSSVQVSKDGTCMYMQVGDDIEYMKFNERDKSLEFSDCDILYCNDDRSVCYMRDRVSSIYYKLKDGEKTELPMSLSGFSSAASAGLNKVFSDGTYYYTVFDRNDSEDSDYRILYYYDGKDAKEIASGISDVNYAGSESSKKVLWYMTGTEGDDYELHIVKEDEEIGSVQLDNCLGSYEVLLSGKTDNFFVSYLTGNPDEWDSAHNTTKKYQIGSDSVKSVATDYSDDYEIGLYFANNNNDENEILYRYDEEDGNLYTYGVAGKVIVRDFQCIANEGGTIYGVNDKKLIVFAGEKQITITDNYDGDNCRIGSGGYILKDYNQSRGSGTLCYFNGSDVEEVEAGVSDIDD